MMNCIRVSITMIVAMGAAAIAGEAPPAGKDTTRMFYQSSLHYTTRGMEHWYLAENGGIEQLTGIAYGKLDCGSCHAGSCDACHATEKDGLHFYSTETARDQAVCLKCHSREKTMIQTDTEKGQLDVHFAAGMQCMDCHSAREIHGDGTEYVSMKQPGMFQVRCEGCHEEIMKTRAHTVHGGKVECKACHIRHVYSCSNCHFDTLISEGRRAAMPLHDWVFLMNYNGSVTSANMQSFLVGDTQTFLVFAPQNSHSIMKDGRDCNACHATEPVRDARNGSVTLAVREGKGMRNLHGVIPVADGVEYTLPYFDLQEGEWVPVEKPDPHIVHHAGFGTPLTRIQLEALSKSVTAEESVKAEDGAVEVAQ